MPKRTRRDPAERFWEKVDKSGECWLWTARCLNSGYGYFSSGVPGASSLAHRFSYELHIGPIPNGMIVMHRCDNPPCVNPAHLLVGTQADNVRDMHAKGRARNGNEAKTHCPQGHPYDEANTYTDKRGFRICVECNRFYARRRWRRRTTGV